MASLTDPSNAQADKLGEKLRNGEIKEEDLELLNKFRASFARSYVAVENVLTEHLACKVTGRPSKSTIAIVEKLRREGSRLTQIQDIAGCRVIVRIPSDQDRLADQIGLWFPEIKIDDRRQRPSHGYRALHLIPRVAGRRVEIQIRSISQHIWAEISEKLADSHGQEVKYGGGPSHVISFLAELSALTEKIDLNYDQKIVLQRRSEIVRAGRSDAAKAAKRTIKHLNTLHRINIRSANHLVSSFLGSSLS